MKKTFKIMISVLVIAITVLGFSFYGNHKVGVNKQKVSEFEVRDYYRMNGLILVQKTDENGDPQSGVTFKAKSLDEEFVYTLRRNNEESSPKYIGGSSYVNYYLETQDDLSKDEFYSFLKPEQISVLESIHTERDLQEKANDNYLCDGYNYTDDNGNPTGESEYNCSLVYPTVFTLEETRVPTGYGKKKILLPAVAYIEYYNYYSSGESHDIDDELSFEYGGVSIIPNGYYMEYGEVDINELLDSDINKVVRLWKNKGIYNTYCNSTTQLYGGLDEGLNTVQNMTQIDFHKAISNSALSFYDGNTCPIALENERGETKLEISSYVNNSEEITTDVNQVIDYKVVVKNTGDFDAVDNKVVSRLPEGFVYVEGSVSNGGRYENGAVTWDIARIEQGEDLTLTYRAYAPKGANTFSSYVGETSVENFALDNNKVEANKTYVKLSLTNPYTYTPIGILVLVLILSVIALTAAVQLKTKKK